MLRFASLLLALTLCTLLLSNAAAPTMARAENSPGGSVPNLKQTLDYGLKARLPSEFAFIRHVVELVDNKTLPRKLVLGTFNWSRGQSEKMPFPYFQFALRLQAKKLGVQL